MHEPACPATPHAPASPMHYPWVSTNLAISADGKITSAARRPSGWTSREDHARLLELRQHADALLVGRATLLADHMRLTVPGRPIQPLRCIASRTGDIPPDHPVFHPGGGPVHILATDAPPQSLRNLPATIHHQTLDHFLKSLHTDHRVATLHCEGGGEIIRRLAALDAIDEFHLTLAGHTLFGAADSPTCTGIPAGFLPHSLAFELTHFDPRPDLGECFLSYRRLRTTGDAPSSRETPPDTPPQ